MDPVTDPITISAPVWQMVVALVTIIGGLVLGMRKFMSPEVRLAAEDGKTLTTIAGELAKLNFKQDQFLANQGEMLHKQDQMLQVQAAQSETLRSIQQQFIFARSPAGGSGDC